MVIAARTGLPAITVAAIEVNQGEFVFRANGINTEAFHSTALEEIVNRAIARLGGIDEQKMNQIRFQSPG